MNDKPAFQPSSRCACVGTSMTGSPSRGPRATDGTSGGGASASSSHRRPDSQPVSIFGVLPRATRSGLRAASCSAACYVITGLTQMFLGSSASLWTSLILLGVAIVLELVVLNILRVKLGKKTKA